MANEDWSLGKLTYATERFETTTKTEEIRFRVFGGRLRIGVYKKDNFRAEFEFGVNNGQLHMILQNIRKILKASPGQKNPIVVSTWDRNERKFKVSHVLTFAKDDKNVYRIELQWKGNKYEAPVRGPSGISYGSDPLSEAERSAIGMEALMEWIDKDVRIMQVLSNKKMERTGGSYGGGSSSGSGSPVLDSGDDIF